MKLMKMGTLSGSLWEALGVRRKTTRFSEESDGKIPEKKK